MRFLWASALSAQSVQLYTHDSLFLALDTPLPWAPNSFPAIFRLGTHIINTHYSTLHYTQYCRTSGTYFVFNWFPSWSFESFVGMYFGLFGNIWKILYLALLLPEWKVSITRCIGFQIFTSWFWIILHPPPTTTKREREKLALTD